MRGGVRVAHSSVFVCVILPIRDALWRIPRSRSGAPPRGQSHERPHPHLGVRPLAARLWLLQRQVPASVRGPRGARDEAARFSPQSAVRSGGAAMMNTVSSLEGIGFYSTGFSHRRSYIHSKNRAGLSFSLAMNSLSDRTMPELLAMRGRKSRNYPNNGLPFLAENYNGVEVPESVDWRLYGAFLELKYTSCLHGLRCVYLLFIYLLIFLMFL